MTVEFINGTACTKFLCEDYFPAIVSFGKETDYCRHVMFKHGDTDALELCLDAESGELIKAVLVLCNHFSFEDGAMRVPMAADCVLRFELPRVTECDAFNMRVYKDGFVIEMGKGAVPTYAKMGQLIFGFTESGEVTEIYVCGLSPKEMAHVETELREG